MANDSASKQLTLANFIVALIVAIVVVMGAVWGMIQAATKNPHPDAVTRNEMSRIEQLLNEREVRYVEKVTALQTQIADLKIEIRELQR